MIQNETTKPPKVSQTEFTGESGMKLRASSLYKDILVLLGKGKTKPVAFVIQVID